MKEALQALVAEMEYVLSCINENKVPFDGDDFHEALRLGREAIEQAQKQEAVLWLVNGVVQSSDLPRDYTGCLYTSPPQRQPLTDEHPLMVFAKECVLGAYSKTELADAAKRAIKAAHGIKGEA